jgi:hypothetical protein
MTSLILPWANTEMMDIFLRQVAEDFSNYFILRLVDQAGWHVSQKLTVPELRPGQAYARSANRE